MGNPPYPPHGQAPPVPPPVLPRGSRQAYTTLAVLGGAEFRDAPRVRAALNLALRKLGRVDRIIVSTRQWPGAEFHACRWAEAAGVYVHVDGPDYSRDGLRAGGEWLRRMRAAQVLGVVAFPGADDGLLQLLQASRFDVWRPFPTSSCLQDKGRAPGC